jgi:hypothetical protein
MYFAKLKSSHLNWRKETSDNNKKVSMERKVKISVSTTLEM